jgi:hypothetical protein
MFKTRSRREIADPMVDFISNVAPGATVSRLHFIPSLLTRCAPSLVVSKRNSVPELGHLLRFSIKCVVPPASLKSAET